MNNNNNQRDRLSCLWVCEVKARTQNYKNLAIEFALTFRFYFPIISENWYWHNAKQCRRIYRYSRFQHLHLCWFNLRYFRLYATAAIVSCWSAVSWILAFVCVFVATLPICMFAQQYFSFVSLIFSSQIFQPNFDSLYRPLLSNFVCIITLEIDLTPRKFGLFHILI